MLGELGILTSANEAELSLGPSPAAEFANTAMLVDGVHFDGTLNDPAVAGALTVVDAATVPACSAWIVYDVIELLPLDSGAVHDTDTVVKPMALVVWAVAETLPGADGPAGAIPETAV